METLNFFYNDNKDGKNKFFSQKRENINYDLNSIIKIDSGEINFQKLPSSKELINYKEAVENEDMKDINTVYNPKDIDTPTRTLSDRQKIYKNDGDEHPSLNDPTFKKWIIDREREGKADKYDKEYISIFNNLEKLPEIIKKTQANEEEYITPEIGKKVPPDTGYFPVAEEEEENPEQKKYTDVGVVPQDTGYFPVAAEKEYLDIKPKPDGTGWKLEDGRWVKEGGRKTKRTKKSKRTKKINKRKTNKRKTNKRKTNKRKTNKRKTRY